MSPKPVFPGARDVLLIGGPHAGTVVSIDPVMRTVHLMYTDPNTLRTMRHLYRIELLLGRDGTRHYVAMHHPVVGDPLAELINHYKETKGFIQS